MHLIHYINFFCLILGLTSCSPQNKVVARKLEIIVDFTAYDKKGLVFDLRKIKDDFLEKAQSEKRIDLLGLKISLTIVDDNGLNTPDWEVQMPLTLGNMSQNLKKQLKVFLGKLDQTIYAVENNQKNYKRSLLLPTIEDRLSQNGKIKLIIISDFAIVSNDQNFEKNQFSPIAPIRYLKKNKEVEFHYLGIPGADIEQTRKIKQWWRTYLKGV